MSAPASDRRARVFLGAMVIAGIATLAIPWFLTPPAYLDLVLRDTAFDADLTRQSVVVTDDDTGRSLTAAVRRVGDQFVARVGRISSGPARYTARMSGYQPGTARFQAAALQNVRVPVSLNPTFGRLEVATFNAMRAADPVAATIKEDTRTLSQEPVRTLTLDLPPGKHRLAAQAPGFCESQREFEVRAGAVTRAAIPLSPDLTADEIARFVLGWREEPEDLDTHFWKSDARTFPTPATVYFKNKTGLLPDGQTFARLDVDERFPGAYETLTVRNAATGDYRYFIHVYHGTGTIADADASVQLYTPGCHVQTFTPPPDCAERIWNVANVHYDGSRMQLEERQKCEPEGTVIVNKLVR